MSGEQWALFALYYGIGFVVLLCITRRINRGLSIADLIAMVIGAVGWPAILIVFGFGYLAFSDSWLTKKTLVTKKPRLAGLFHTTSRLVQGQ
ncbi:MAG: hypothetical protein H7255_09070 [Ramlibacter sp.]|nr:hypothetical protein [Ramlibacter sp.]